MRFLWLLLCAFVWVMEARGASVPLELDGRRVHELRFEEKEAGQYVLETLGSDPYVLTREVALDALQGELCVVAFEYFCPDGVDNLQVFFGPPLSAAQSAHYGPLAKAETWQPVAVNLSALAAGSWKSPASQYRLDFGSRGGIGIRIRNLHLRTRDEREVRLETEAAEGERHKREQALILKGYLEREYGSVIRSVRVRGEEIEVRGRVGAGREAYLGEVEMHGVGWDGTGIRVGSRLSEGEFCVVLSRREAGRDRLFSRWGVVSQRADGQIVCDSHQVYANPGSDLGNAVEAERIRRRGKKGMGGVLSNAISGELREMGVEHVTVNVDLRSLFGVTPREGFHCYRFEGKEYGVSRSALDALDSTMREFSAGSVVSAIVLVGFPKSTEDRRLMTHPESGPPGVYAMPNLTSEEGVQFYRAALAFLAERYSGREQGLISHWILHNEVDYAHTWTNMGEQPMGLFMDQYARSMRIAYLTARQWNPAADVFISLTHNWMTPEGKEGRNYCVREMLERLVSHSKREGDFEWGIAYHPYPESLFEPATWRDRRAVWDFDTELITPKNIEVLDAYLHRPEMLYQGKALRRVLLSEQGFHTRNEGVEAQRLQAAALVYIWHKIRPLESIEAFHNHRWQDHPGEGGLMVGLRTLPSPGKPFGERKFAWEVYAALDTPREAEITAFAKEILGVQHLEEIPHRAPITGGVRPRPPGR
jgi:hypothetical protein